MFRRFECKPIAINANQTEFMSDSLLTIRQLPAKILFAFVKTSAYVGNYRKNGFEFVRGFDKMGPGDKVWRKKTKRTRATQAGSTTASESGDPVPSGSQGLISRAVNSLVGTRKGGRPKKTPPPRPPPPNPPPPPSSNPFAPSAPPEPAVELESSSDEEIQLADKKVGMICMTKLELECGGNVVDALKQGHTESDALIDFVRYNLFNGTLDSPYTSSIEYSEFCRDFFISSFDLTTNLNANLAFLIPSTRYL